MKILRSLNVLGLFAGLLTVLSSAAFAADGTITFSGNIAAQTCTIDAGTPNFTVTLPTISASSLATVGSVAGRTAFSISLTACAPTTGNVHTFFEPGVTTDTTTGHLTVTGGAANVEIDLLNSDFTDINTGAAEGSQNSKSVALTAGAATLHYYAQYLATGAVASGLANSTVTYTLVYN